MMRESTDFHKTALQKVQGARHKEKIEIVFGF
jgi:hypothetical protein